MSLKKLLQPVIVSSLFAMTFCFAGCSSLKTDFEKAKSEAAKNDKGILLYFSGDSWNSDSVTFADSVLNSSTFRRETKNDYIFVKLDFESAVGDENTNSEMEEKNKYREFYDVKQFPCVYLLTQEGYVKLVIPYSSLVSTPEGMLNEIEKNRDLISSIDSKAKKIRETEGNEKVYAINDLYDATAEKYRLILGDLCKEVTVLDPYNETGLLGKYELEAAYINAIRRAQNDDFDGVENIFCDICQNGHLTKSEQQRAYYTAAFVLSAMGCTDYERIIDLLQLSYNADSKGENAKKVKEVLNSFNQIAFTVKIISMEDAATMESEE